MTFLVGPHAISTSLKLAWKGYGSDLLLTIQDGSTHTDCSLRTLEADDQHDFDFRGTAIRSRVTISSESLREAFGELDWSSPYVSILVSDEAPYFRIATSGSSGSCQVEYGRDSPAFDSFEASGSQKHSYKLALLQPCVKALHGASKTQIQINEAGLLSLQHLIKAADGTSSVVDFLFVPALDDTEGYEPMNLSDED